MRGSDMMRSFIMWSLPEMPGRLNKPVEAQARLNNNNKDSVRTSKRTQPVTIIHISFVTLFKKVIPEVQSLLGCSAV
jgi:hypothetical protein